jgi:pseudaminic acid biosynthesis-associated methylase
MKGVKQTNFWKGQFGKEYTDRCTFNNKKLDERFLKQFGKSKSQMDKEFIGNLSKKNKVLEVGCNTGQKLVSLQAQGFENLYGVELQWYAIEKSKTLTNNINIIQGNAFDIPFKNGFFDLVFTSGVLIHITPNKLKYVMNEIYRCTSKYIWGWEYYSEKTKEINYRSNKEFLWKGDYCQLYLDQFSNLKLIKKEIVSFINDSEKGNLNSMFLLEKIN